MPKIESFATWLALATRGKLVIYHPAATTPHTQKWPVGTNCGCPSPGSVRSSGMDQFQLVHNTQWKYERETIECDEWTIPLRNGHRLTRGWIDWLELCGVVGYRLSNRGHSIVKQSSNHMLIDLFWSGRNKVTLLEQLELDSGLERKNFRNMLQPR